jgi:hypothetical protein
VEKNMAKLELPSEKEYASKNEGYDNLARDIFDTCVMTINTNEEF